MVIAGKYRLVRKLASGGMGEVFLAVLAGPQGIEKRVVLKRVLAQRDGDVSSTKMFLDEARVAADLHHPNVVDVYEVGEHEGTWFLAMEYLDGWDLRRIQTEAMLSRRPVPLGPALHVIADIARGLHHAHEKRAPDGRALRIVHRDVSPQNVLVTRDGVAKLLDFGIAKADIARAEVTDPGMVKGKVAYMSPEQATGGEVDRRSDLFSLGIVLYELTTMSRVYFGEDLRVLFNRVAEGKIAAPSSIVPDYPKRLEELVQMALAPRPSQRFESGDAFATALEDLLDDGGVPHSANKVARYLRTLFGDEDSLASLRVKGTEAATVQTPACAPVPVPAVVTAEPKSVVRAIAEDETPPADERALLEALKQMLDAGDRARLTNAAEPEDPLFGRDADLAAVERRFADGARLVTLHGGGGVGKTRLALRLAARLAGAAFPAGAWFVDLSQAKTADSVCGEVGAVLGVPVTAGDGVEQLGRAIAGRGRMLLVLDNFDQLVEHAEATVGRWLRVAPNARFLVASREPLRVADEQVHPVEPLALPEPGSPPADSPAMQLFLQRARKAKPGFAPDAAEWPVLVEIVSGLDGLPLALELAAARLSVLTPSKMLALFPKRLELLSDARGTRRQTLRGALDASWDLLRPYEKDAFAQTAVFRGGFDLTAAEAVFDLSKHADAPWTLDVLQSLCEKSLLKAREMSALPGETRFSMYANVRDYAKAKLEEAGGTDAIARHTDWYLRAAGDWSAGVETHGGMERRRRLGVEHENVEAVLERAVAAPRSPESATSALRAAVALDPVLTARGPLSAHLANLDGAIAAADGQAVPAASLAAALLARGRTRRLSGRVKEALTDLGRALVEARASADRGLVAEVLLQTGAAEVSRGNADRARAMNEEALEIATNAGDRRREALAEGAIAALPYGPDPDEQLRAGERFRRALALHRGLGSQRQVAVVLGNYGIFLRRQGRFDEALAAESEALSRIRELGDRLLEGNKLGTLAGLRMDAAAYDEAAALYVQALEVTRAVGNRRSEAIFRGNASILDHLRARFDDARTGYEAAIVLLDEVGDGLLAALYRAYLAALFADTDHPVPAQRAIDAARTGIAAGKDPLIVEAVELLALHLEVARARRAKPDDAKALFESARQRLADARRSGPKGSASLVGQHEDVRLASRLLELAIARASSP